MSRQCPSCGAEISPLTATCEYCGISTVPIPLSFVQQEAIFKMVNHVNAVLETRCEQITQRVNLFTLLGFAIFLLLLTLVRTVFGFPWSVAAEITLAAVIAAIITSSILKSRYVGRVSGHVFRVEIQPEIERFLQNNPMPRWQFENLGRDSLTEDAILRNFFRKNAKTE